MRLRKATALAGLAFSSPALAATSEQWRGRSVYQVLTDRFARTDGSTDATCNTSDRLYCGGTFKGIESHLDYIQGMGFDAVWISPVTAQIEDVTPYGEAYHGYWQRDIFSINSYFGTEDDLIDLSNALHDREMYLMLDVVFNHYASNGPPSDVDYTTFTPFNTSSAYHPYCPIDFANTANTTQLEQCWMGDTTVSLPDLRTEDPSIAAQWNDWIADMIATYNIDGLRLDSAIEVNPSFWPDFSSAAGGTYFVGETYNENVDFVCAFQQEEPGMPGVMDYPAYFPLLAAFSATPPTSPDLLVNLANTIDAVKASCRDTSLKGTFTENHDRPRIAHLNPDFSAAENVIVYTLLSDGIPIIYQGQEQHYASLGGAEDPYNREALWLSGYNTSSPLYTLISKLNALRKTAIASSSTSDDYLTYRAWPIYTDTTTLALRKGPIVTILSNKGSIGDAYTQVIPAGYSAGEQVAEVLSCEVLTADGNGGVEVSMGDGRPKVVVPVALLEGSGICVVRVTATGGGGGGGGRDGDDEGVPGARESGSGSEKVRRSAVWHSLKKHLRWHH